MTMPEVNETGTYNLTVSIGDQTSEAIDFYQYRPLSLSPPFGPIRGTTSIVVAGLDFVNSSRRVTGRTAIHDVL